MKSSGDKLPSIEELFNALEDALGEIFSCQCTLGGVLLKAVLYIRATIFKGKEMITELARAKRGVTWHLKGSCCGQWCGHTKGVKTTTEIHKVWKDLTLRR
jgi:hypothetical protein